MYTDNNVNEVKAWRMLTPRGDCCGRRRDHELQFPRGKGAQTHYGRRTS